MTDDPLQPRIARPIGVPILARPAARPTRAYAVAPPLRRYPESNMTRRQAIVDLAIIFLSLIAASVAIGLLDPVMAEAFPELGILWGNTLVGIVTIATIAVIVRARRQSPASIGVAVPHPARAIIGTLVAVPACYVVFVPAVGIYLYLAGVDMTEMAEERQVFFDMMPETSVLSLLLLAVFTGMHEELLFRGFILTRFNAMFRSKIAAIVFCGALFGLAHAYQGPIGIIQTTAVGLVLGTIVTLTRSIWPAIIAHGLFNSIGLALIPLLRDHMDEFVDQVTTTQAAGL